MPALVCGCLLISLQNLYPQQAQPNSPELQPVRTTITISDTIRAEAPSSITDLSRNQIRRIPGVNLDDRLRTIPGFTLFRRTSSIVANPTTQGVSLRAVGSNGASRTLMLWDSIPVNDPFGGWVYWTRIPPEEIEEVDVVRGGSSSIFGDRAMGGVISVFSREPADFHARLSVDGGNEGTSEVGGSLSGTHRWFGIGTQIRAFSTDGYFIVPEGIRGPVDTPANVRFVAGSTRLDFFGARQRLFVKLDILAEDRANGTVLQRNSTNLGTLSADYNWQSGSNAITALAYHTRDEFRASFSAVSANRQTERLTYLQSVPSDGTGGAGFFSHSWASASALAGADFEHVEGYSTDRIVPAGTRIGGGSLFRRAGFAQGNLKTAAVQWFAGARENWTGDGGTFFSPNGGVAAATGRFRFRGSVFRAFRAPTLNELYREFRTGNTSTLPNPALTPETVFGAETGMDFISETRRLSVTAFRNDLGGLITNVTLSATPQAIVRQRRNAADALSRGFEANFLQRWRAFNFDAAYLYADARYVTGLRVPQIPRNQGSARLTWTTNRTIISAGVLAYSLQFEDDLNQFPLPGFATMQLYARQILGAGVSAVAAFENLLDRQYLVGFTPTPNIGPPRLWRLGLRWELRP